jgi:hypothetical protein
MKPPVLLGCVLVAMAAGCASTTTTNSGTPTHYGDDRSNRVVDAPRDNSNSTGAGATDMRGGGRGGEHRIEKH